ncbi:uncharacterized protein LOC102292663 [Haplochromis burtoni]|uniref:uncharacterized protein LOC102292663 n=1 Tax=Haplochromis burtoni TaxID=8153 RepID=UPI0003BC778F|nr:uncharacterized protein LOC102292663 [Haplochromis burtoni]
MGKKQTNVYSSTCSENIAQAKHRDSLLGNMSTDRPKRNVIRKRYDISDGMPWCEERLVRKVLFLSLREYRDKHRAAHTHSHKCPHALQKTLTKPNAHKKTQARKNMHTQQQRLTCKQLNTYTQANTRTAQNLHVSKRLHAEHTNKRQTAHLNWVSHSPESKCTRILRNTQTRMKLCKRKVAHTRQRTCTDQKTSSTRTLRSNKTRNTLSLQNSKYPKPAKRTDTAQRAHSLNNMCRSKNTKMPLRAALSARTLRSHTPTSVCGSVVNTAIKRRAAGPNWSWSLQTQQRHPTSSRGDEDDCAKNRPRLHAQRKFAQSPPSSPGPLVLMRSAQNTHSHSLAVVTCLTKRRPKTEDFLSFLCLRGSAALPRNMAFLTSKRDREPGDSQRLPSCHKAPAEEKKIRMLCRKTVHSDSRSLKRRPASPAVLRSTCPLTARAQRRMDRDEREGKQQKKGVEGDRREGAQIHLLRPRQHLLHVKRANKVAMVTKISEQRTSCVASVIPLTPRTGVGNKQGTRPSNTYKSRRHPQSRAQESSNKYHPLHHNHRRANNQHLRHPTLSKYYSIHTTFSILHNSGRNSCQTPCLNKRSVSRRLNENPVVLRLSRRRRGLPPDTSPVLPNRVPLDKNSSNECQTSQDKDARVSQESDIYEIQQKGDNVREDYVNMCKHSGNHDVKAVGKRYGHVGDVKLERGKGNIEKLPVASTAALEASDQRESLTNVSTSYNLMPAGEVVWKHLREKTLQKHQNSAILKPPARANESRAAAARTSVTKAAINSVTSDPPANSFSRHSAKGTDNSKKIKKSSLRAGTNIARESKSATKQSSMSTTKDTCKDGALTISYCSASKEGLLQAKPTTSAIKTRFSSRILLKH